MSIRISAIAYVVGSTPFQVQLCPITGQLRVTSPSVKTYAPVDSEGHRVGRLVWDGAAAAMQPKAKPKRRATGATP